MMTQTECTSCSVAATGTDGLCDFCRHYDPPADAVTAGLADAFAAASSAADRLGTLISDLPGDTPIWAVVDLTRACGHLRAAARLVDKAAARITAVEALPR